jgi:sugar phosphate isomerase/epimerase
MNKLFVQTTENVDYDFIELARTESYGVEITSFALPWILDEKLEPIFQSYKLALKDFRNEVAIHGVFMDIITTSRDSKIAGVAKERILKNIEIAKKIGAKIVTFCSCYNPCIATSSPGYFDGYKQRQIAFWSNIIESISDDALLVVFENLWETKPELVKDVSDGVNLYNFKALLDTGHANIFSKVPMEKWVETLADHLTYIHLNDNHGDFDNNLVPGEGNIKWDKFFESLKCYGLKPRICLEVEAYAGRSKLENTKRAIGYLKRMKFYPF